MRLLESLGPAQLHELANKLRTGTVKSVRPTIERWPANASILEELETLVKRVGKEATSAICDMLAEERRSAETQADRRVELVWTGPERDGAGTRDTAVAVRELFSQADHSVIVSGYSVFGGKEIFAPLAVRMLERPTMDVQLFLNVTPAVGGTATEDQLLRRFRKRFLEREWPGGPGRPPRLFFDPRSLVPQIASRAVLHAKCVVVDDARCLVTSANITEAAQVRNIEAGVLVNDHLFAKSLSLQFRALIESGELKEISP